MSRRFATFQLAHPTSLILQETTQIFSPFHMDPLESELDLLLAPPFFDLLDHELTIPTQLVTRRLTPKPKPLPLLLPQLTPTEFYLQSLSDRIAALESTILPTQPKPKLDRKYTWTAEITSDQKDGLDRKYKLTTEIKAGKKKEDKSYKWTAQIKGKGDSSKINRKYTFEASLDNAGDDLNKKDKKKNDVVYKKSKKPVAAPARVVEIEEESADQGAIVLRQAFAKRAAAKSKGKRKELSYQDAAIMIQVCFRAYLIRRSQALRALRELAVAKAKLKELRALFNNFTYRRQLTLNAEERQKFSERIIVLLLTVDAIEGSCEALSRSCGCCGSLIEDEVQREQCESGCDFATHVFFHPCALCQEGREIRRRLPHPGFNAQPVLVMLPPGEQSMGRG